jgi:hypothetical protein
MERGEWLELRRQRALPVAWPVMAERSPQVVAGMPRRHPFLWTPAAAVVSQAADHDVTAAGFLRRVAVARLPGHRSGARPPCMAEPALFRDERKTQLPHDSIQTHIRMKRNLLRSR